MIRREFNNPPGRARHAMAYDKSNHLIVMFGGYYYSSSEGDVRFRDTWIFNLSNDHWTNVTPAISPPYLEGCRMVYDETIQNCVLFGGNETWVFNTTTNLWTNRTTASGPAFRTGHSFVYDSDNGICILYGGSNGPARFGDTWAYDAAKNVWVQKYVRIRPGAYCGSQFVYDSQNDKALLFGGWYQNEHFDNTTWIFSPSTNTWQMMNPAQSPPARAYPSMVFDESNGVFVLFGGWDAYKSFLNDTWTYDYETDAWVDKNPALSPPANRDWQMTYDSKRGLAFLFGVVSENGTDNCETWIYNVSFNVWKKMEPENSPPTIGPTAYDESRAVICLCDRDNGLWRYDFVEDNWTQLPSVSSPGYFFTSHLLYDKWNDSMILCGGGGNPSDYYEMWSYDIAANYYMKLNYAVKPPLARVEGLASDPDSGLLFMYGGVPPQSTQYSQTDKFWIFGQPGFFPKATYESNIFGMNGSAFFDTLDWIGNETISSRIRLQLRSANSPDELNHTEFTGADGTSGSYYQCSGHKINGIHDDSRFIQYRAYLDTSNPIETPILSSVTIDYNLIHQLHVLSPAGAENWSGLAQITWSVLDPDNDSISVDIYLDNDNSSTLIFSNLPADSNTTNWNTTDTPNGTYRIRIVARDDNPSIPLSVTEVSGNFTIFHPPPIKPNRPPHVEMLSPGNDSVVNSTSVRLAWNGTDPDGDDLNYIVHFSERPAEEMAGEFIPTREVFLDFYDLEDGVTYYWTVDAGDGINRTSETPLPVWHFTVKLPGPPPPVNHPPKITSAPVQALKVNESWTYRLLARDEDADPLTFSFVGIPDGMTFESSAMALSWTPHTGQTGNHTMTVSVSDDRGGLDWQSFTLFVRDAPVPADMPPSCTIDLPANGSVVKGTANVSGRAFNGTLPLTTVLIRVDGGKWQSARGLANWSFGIDTKKLQNGPHWIEARSYDGARFSNTTAIRVIVQNPVEVVTTGNQYCQPALILAAILGLVFVMSLAFRKKKDQG